MRTWREELRDQLRLAVPVILVQLGLRSMGTIDEMFVGRVSAADYAGTSLGHAYSFGFIAFLLGVLAALDPLVSQAFGARDERAIAVAFQRGILLALLLSIPVALALLPARAVMTAMGTRPEIAEIAARFAVVSALGVPGFALFVAQRTALQAMHLLRPLVIVMVLANLLNAFLDWVLVFGNLGFPAMGAVGSAWGTVIARWFLALGVPLLAWSEVRRYARPLRAEVRDGRALWRVALLGIPIGATYVFELGAFVLVAFLISRMDPERLAGHQVALTLASNSFMVALGISQAAAIRVGNEIGRGDQHAAKLAAKVAFVLGAGVMLVFALIFFAIPGPLARIFTHDVDVIAAAKTLIPLAALFQVFDGTQIVAISVLRGAADVRWPMLIHLVGFWVFGIPIGLWLAYGRDLGAPGLWWGLALGLGAVAIVQFLRVRVRLRQALLRVSVESPQVP